MTPTRPRRGGRPTLAEATQLDHDVQEAALALFLEHGYDGASMDAIARAAGTTKASLYARFAGKDAVFRAVFAWAMNRPDWPLPEPAPPAPDEDLETALTAIAQAAVRRALDPSMIKLGRVAIAHATVFPEIARQMYATGHYPRRRIVVDILERHAAAGTIVADEPEILAEHFFAMMAGMPARLASFGILRDPAEQDHHTRVAVQLFLRSLRPS